MVTDMPPVLWVTLVSLLGTACPNCPLHALCFSPSNCSVRQHCGLACPFPIAGCQLTPPFTESGALQGCRPWGSPGQLASPYHSPSAPPFLKLCPPWASRNPYPQPGSPPKPLTTILHPHSLPALLPLTSRLPSALTRPC